MIEFIPIRPVNKSHKSHFYFTEVGEKDACIHRPSPLRGDEL